MMYCKSDYVKQKKKKKFDDIGSVQIEFILLKLKTEN